MNVSKCNKEIIIMGDCIIDFLKKSHIKSLKPIMQLYAQKNFHYLTNTNHNGTVKTDLKPTVQNKDCKRKYKTKVSYWSTYPRFGKETEKQNLLRTSTSTRSTKWKQRKTTECWKNMSYNPIKRQLKWPENFLGRDCMHFSFKINV